MSVRVDARQAIQGLTNLSRGLPQASATARRVSAQAGVDGARSRVHVITGRLRNSLRIISETQEMTRFGSDVEYAGHEEFRPGHAYLTPEYNRMQTYFPEQFMATLRRIF